MTRIIDHWLSTLETLRWFWSDAFPLRLSGFASSNYVLSRTAAHEKVLYFEHETTSEIGLILVLRACLTVSILRYKQRSPESFNSKVYTKISVFSSNLERFRGVLPHFPCSYNKGSVPEW